MIRKTAYTKIDLLVTIVCVSMLMLCVGAVGLNGREMAKRTVCASNINQHLEAMFAYANDSDGEFHKRIPGYWLMDLDGLVRDPLMDQYGVQREAFYCPSNDIQQKHMNVYFHLSDYFQRSDSFSVMSYSYLVESMESAQDRIWGRGNKKWVSSIHAENASSAELVIDTTFSVPRFTDNLECNFRRVPNAVFVIIAIYDSSNHLKTEIEPWGGNIGFLDGHVSWRPFADMEARYGTQPTYWW